MKKKNVLIHYMKADPCHGIKTRTKTGNSASTINFAVNTSIPLIFILNVPVSKNMGPDLICKPESFGEK